MHIDEMQCSYSKHFDLVTVTGKIFSKNNNFYYPLVDLESAFHGVPRDVVWCALLKLVLRVNNTVSDFMVHIGLHQYSVSSSLLFMVMLEAFYGENSPGSLQEMLYASDLTLVKQ